MDISVSYLCRFYLASMEWTNLFVVKKKNDTFITFGRTRRIKQDLSNRTGTIT